MISIKSIPPNNWVEGLSVWGTNTIYVSENAQGEGNVALALAVFAEFQHLPEGGSMDEASAQTEFRAVRNMLPAAVRTPYINNLHHRGTTN